MLETVAGKNRGNQISALIQAFQSGQVENALQASVGSDGSALEEQTKWLDSLEAKVQQFKAQFQELSNTALSSDFLKGIVDAGTLSLELLTKLIDSFGILQTLIGGFAIGKGITSFVKNFDKSVYIVN